MLAVVLDRPFALVADNEIFVDGHRLVAQQDHRVTLPHDWQRKKTPPSS